MVPNAAAVTNLFLRGQVDDGMIVWINGVEVLRTNAPAGEVPYVLVNTKQPELDYPSLSAGTATAMLLVWQNGSIIDVLSVWGQRIMGQRVRRDAERREVLEVDREQAAGGLDRLAHRRQRLAPVDADLRRERVPPRADAADDAIGREVIEREIDVIRALGVEIRCGVTVGKDISFATLRRDFAAVIVAVGSELLTPFRTDTNSLFITSGLNDLGIEVDDALEISEQTEI